MIWRLALLFTVVPTVELALLIFIGTNLGVLPTTAIILLTGFAGAWLAKREGLGVLQRLQADLNQGLPPASRLMEAALVLAGALFLITPGIFTDITGFLLIIPATRRLIAPVVLRYLARRFVGSAQVQSGPDGMSVQFGAGASKPKSDPTPRENPFDHPVR